MDPEFRNILDDIFVNVGELRDTALSLYQNNNLSAAESIVRKDCLQSVDFFEIFESHMYYANIKPLSNADEQYQLIAIAQGCLMSFYAGVCSVTQKKHSGKMINQLNNTEFDTYLRLRITHENIFSIIEQECPSLIVDTDKVSRFNAQYVEFLRSHYGLRMCLEVQNTERIFSPIYDAGVTYATHRFVE